MIEGNANAGRVKTSGCHFFCGRSWIATQDNYPNLWGKKYGMKSYQTA
tara:strand:- start:30928 stop:31071 length:144 start_codon:yes stop_codon:yes gene_type:complete